MHSELHWLALVLCLCGGAQEGYQTTFRFQLSGMRELQRVLAKLRADMAAWQSLVDKARTQFYFLNYFSMREILRLAAILR